MNTYPIFRLAISLAAGILFANTYWTGNMTWQIGILLSILLALGCLLKNPSYAGRWVFGAGVSCFMFFVGVVLTGYAWEKVKADLSPSRLVYNGRLVESLVEKVKTYQCRVETRDKEVLLYFPKDSMSASLKPGDEILFRARMEGNYAPYLYYDGISGTAYVPADAWKKTGNRDWDNLKTKALYLREWLIGKYRQWGIGDEELPVLSALTLGYKGELDKETREAYSVAGISHVLALSGMHIGIIWFLLRWLKGGLVIPLLWGFAFIVGLEPSVVRAVVMCMLMELGRLSGSKVFSMNTLCVAAFFMLLYHPLYLFDVGFQLSFVAVASILFFYPPMFSLFFFQNKLLRWTWGILCVSMAAQLGTAPLVMYYFSNFSVYFLMTNLVASVLVPFIIYGAVLLVVMMPFPGCQRCVAWCLNSMVDGLNAMAGWVSGLPHATFSLSILNPLEIMVFYVMLGMWLMYARCRRRKWLTRGLFWTACLLMLHFCFLLYCCK